MGASPFSPAAGTHRQLVELGGVYASMAAKQALKFGDEDADSAEEGGREQGGGKGGADATAQVKNAGPRGKGVKPRTLRESILRRGSVRLSIIPLALKEKLAAGGVAAGGASAGADGGGALRRLAVLNRPEWRHLLLGLLCSTALGLTVRFSGMLGGPASCAECAQPSALCECTPTILIPPFISSAVPRLQRGHQRGRLRPVATRRLGHPGRRQQVGPGVYRHRPRLPDAARRRGEISKLLLLH